MCPRMLAWGRTFGRLGHLVLLVLVERRSSRAGCCWSSGPWPSRPRWPRELTATEEAGFLPEDSPARYAAQRRHRPFPEWQAAATATIAASLRPPTTLMDADHRAINAVATWPRSRPPSRVDGRPRLHRGRGRRPRRPGLCTAASMVPWRCSPCGSLPTPWASPPDMPWRRFVPASPASTVGAWRPR